MNMNLPNWLTLLRLCLVPVVIASISQHRFDLAFAAFAIAGFTDAIDGFIARRFNLMTELGALLDPIADKALLVSIYITLSIAGFIPAWMAILVVSRDLMIVGAVILSWFMENPVEIRPLLVSKANTAAQILFAAFTLATLAFNLDLAHIQMPLMLAVCVLTTASMLAYLRGWLKHMSL